MKRRTIHIDFFRTLNFSKPFDFSNAFKQFAVADVAGRTYPCGADYVRIRSVKFEGALIFGEFSKLRMDNLPTKGSINSADVAIRFADNEGLVEDRAFIYVPEFKVLILERNRLSAGIGQVETLFLSKNCGLFELSPVLELTAYKKLHSLTNSRRFEIDFAAPDHVKSILGGDSSIVGALDAAMDLRAPRASLIFTMGKRKGSMATEKIIKLAEKLASIGQKDADIKKVIVTGDDGTGGEILRVDLLEDRMFNRITFDHPDRTKVPLPTRFKLLGESLDNRREMLASLFEKD
jgi:hypothetical protein